MKYLKFTLLSSFLALIALFTYVFFSFDENYQEKQIFEAFQNNEMDKATLMLAEVKDKLPGEQSALIEGIFFSKQREFTASEESLSKALTLSSSEVLNCSIHQVRAINAYLSGDFASLKEILDRLEHSSGKTPFSTFFSGLHALINADYSYAEKLLQLPIEDSSANIWLTSVFNHSFPPALTKLLLARTKLESSPSEAQALLEEALTEGYPDITHTYLALSFASEASHKLYPQRIAYDKMAYDELKKASFGSPLFQIEEEKLAKHFAMLGEILIENEDLEALKMPLELLESWGENQRIADIAEALVSKIVKISQKEQADDALSLAQAIDNKLPLSSEVRNLIEQKMKKRLFSYLEKGSVSQLREEWQVFQTLSRSPQLLLRSFNQELTEQILSQATQNTSNIEQIKNLLGLYDQFENTPKNRYLLASQLAATATGIWVSGSSPQKAYELIIEASRIPYSEERKELLASISEFLIEAYRFAKQNDDVENLPYLQRALSHFDIAIDDEGGAVEVQNQLADAKEMLSLGQLFEARKKTEWILELSPDSEEAKRLLGMIAYAEADYAKAASILSNINTLSLEAKEALGISLLFEGQTEEGENQLMALSHEKPLSDFALHQLALSSLLRKDYALAQSFLDQIETPQQETYALLCISSSGLEANREALYYFAQLSPLFNQSPLLLSMAFQAHANLGHLKEAELIVREIENNLSSPLPDQWSSQFEHLHKVLWDEQAFYTIAGDFYQKRLEKGEEALHFYQKSKGVETLSLKLKKANAYLLKEDPQTALKIAKEAYSSQKSPEALTMILRAYQEQGAYYEAYHTYQNSAKNGDPIDLKTRIAAARVASSLHSWDKARVLWSILEGVTKLSTSDLLLAAKSYAYTGKIKDKQRILEQIKLRAPKLSALEKIELVQTLSTLEGKLPAQSFLQAFPTFSIGNNKNIIPLVALYIELEDKESVASLRDAYLSQFQESTQGLEVLASSYLLSGDKESLLDTLTKLIERSPEAALRSPLLKQVSLPQNLIENLASSIPKLLSEDPSNAPLLAAEATLLLAHQRPELLSAKLNSTHKVIKSYIKKFPEEAYLSLLEADLYLLQGFNKQAEKAAARAYSLDPRSYPAIQMLALSYKAQGNPTKALSLFEKISHSQNLFHSKQEGIALKKLVERNTY